jgi:hypothetical protein
MSSGVLSGIVITHHWSENGLWKQKVSLGSEEFVEAIWRCTHLWEVIEAGNAGNLPTFQGSAAGVSQGVTENIVPICTIKVYAGGGGVQVELHSFLAQMTFKWLTSSQSQFAPGKKPAPTEEEAMWDATEAAVIWTALKNL